MRWKVASDLRFQVAISEAESPSFCGISGDLAPSMRKSLAIAIVRFWCAKHRRCSLEQRGGGAQPPPRGSPRATFWRDGLFGHVSVMLRNSVLDDCLLGFPLVSAVVSAVLYGHLRTAKCWDNTFGVFALCQVGCSLFAPPGAVPVVGGYLYPSVLRSPGVTPQECRAAHGPLHPAVTSPPRHCWFGIWILLGFSGMDVGYSVWCFFVSGVG